MSEEEDDNLVTCCSCDTNIHIDDAEIGPYGYLCEGCDEAAGHAEMIDID